MFLVYDLRTKILEVVNKKEESEVSLNNTQRLVKVDRGDLIIFKEEDKYCFKYNDYYALNTSTYEFKFSENYNDCFMSLEQLLVEYGFGFMKYKKEKNIYIKEPHNPISRVEYCIFTHPRSDIKIFYKFDTTYYLNKEALENFKKDIDYNILNDKDFKDNISKEDLKKLIKKHVESFKGDFFRDCEFEHQYLLCPDCYRLGEYKKQCVNCGELLDSLGDYCSFVKDDINTVNIKVSESKEETLFELTLFVNYIEVDSIPFIVERVQKLNLSEKEINKKVKEILEKHEIEDCKYEVFKKQTNSK